MTQRIGSIILLALLVACPVSATDNSAEKGKLINELIEITGGEQTFLQLVDSMLVSFRNQAFSLNDDHEPTEAEKKQITDFNRIFDRYRELFRSELNYQDYRDQVLVPIYDRNYSTGEIRDLIAFYQTPTGAKSLRVMPTVFQESIRDSAQYMQPVLKRIIEQIGAEEEARVPWKRTMRDIETIAGALDDYEIDHGGYPDAVSLDDLEAVLVPEYLDSLPRADVWGNPYTYIVSSDHENYRVISAGADGVVDWESRRFTEVDYDDYVPRFTSDLRDDIVNQWGYFVQLPEQERSRYEPVDD